MAGGDRHHVTVPIARGENQGKTITYNNVVRELMPIGMWNGQPMTVQLERHSFMRARRRQVRRVPAARPGRPHRRRGAPSPVLAGSGALIRTERQPMSTFLGPPR